MRERVYKRRGWAQRAAAKLKWHCVQELPYRPGFIVRAMTAEERDRAKRGIQLSEMLLHYYRPAIEAQVNARTMLVFR